MAHLKTKATTGKLPQREQWKWKLIRGLYEKEFEREQIIKLFEIIDNMMTLSPELQSSLESKIKQFEEERTMPLRLFRTCHVKLKKKQTIIADQ
jgi:hypothetical protein